METERFLLIKEIFQAALERQPEERAAYLAAVCAGDEELRAEVAALLAQEAETFLETPALEKHARLFAPTESVQLKAGELLSHYRIISLLGRGGMGEVYLAEDVRFERKVAVKLLRGEWMNDAERVRRFQQEARAVSALNHPNIVTVHDIGQVGAFHFITTEFVDGQTLRQKLKSGRLELREVLEVGLQVAAALVAAHAAGIVHRDIKPENVMVRGDGYVKVLDFGIAKRTSPRASESKEANAESLTTTGVIMGTAAYMSPEQARGQKLDARTDVFSLGVLIYEMVTGQPPFSGETKADVIADILKQEPPPLTPLALQHCVARALRKKPEERQQTSGELLAELKALKEDLELREKSGQPPFPPPIPAPEEEHEPLPPLLSEFDRSPRLQAWLRRNPQGGGLALAAALGALAAIVLSWFVGAACIRVTLSPECPPAQAQTLIFGYLAELNAGFLYLVGIPVFIVTGFHLLNLAHVMLRRLVSGNRLIVLRWEQTEARPDPLELIGQYNRALCRALLPLFVLVAVVLMPVGEYRDRNKLAFGWVQALSIKDLAGKDLMQLSGEKNIEGLPLLADLRASNPACVIRVSKVTGGHGSAERGKWLAPFLVFLAIALGLQIAFLVFALWIVTKITFLFVLLSYALLDRPGQRFKIILDFEDEKRRFGLTALDTIHTAFLTLVFIACLIVVLQHLGNVAKGTSVFSGAVSLSLSGQALLFIGALCALFLLLLLPVLVFIRLIETAVGRHLEGLDRTEAELRKALAGEAPVQLSQASLKALQDKRELVRQQRPWPRENAPYRWLLLADIVLLLILLSNRYGGLFGKSVFTALARDLSEWLCAFTQFGRQ